MLLMMEGRRDVRRLRATRGELLTESHAPEMLAKGYREYTTTVSTEVMAVSWETAHFLWSLCQVLRPQRILDLGSGFSTFIFAMYGEALVLSIDDSPSWLERTRTYVGSSSVEFGSLDALHAMREPFDLVFHDIGITAVSSTPLRVSLMQKAADRVTSKGVLVLDDMHKKPVRSAAQALTGGDLFNLRPITGDRWGRFSSLWLPSG
jgi:predicted O-methyltransferase YrrM